MSRSQGHGDSKRSRRTRTVRLVDEDDHGEFTIKRKSPSSKGSGGRFSFSPTSSSSKARARVHHVGHNEGAPYEYVPTRPVIVLVDRSSQTMSGERRSSVSDPKVLMEIATRKNMLRRRNSSMGDAELKALREREASASGRLRISVRTEGKGDMSTYTPDGRTAPMRGARRRRSSMMGLAEYCSGGMSFAESKDQYVLLVNGGFDLAGMTSKLSFHQFLRFLRGITAFQKLWRRQRWFKKVKREKHFITVKTERKQNVHIDFALMTHPTFASFLRIVINLQIKFRRILSDRRARRKQQASLERARAEDNFEKKVKSKRELRQQTVGQQRQISKTVDSLNRVPLLSRLAACDRVALGKLLSERTYAKGDQVIRYGQEGKEFFIITKGRATVSRYNAKSGTNTVLNTLGVGDYFGEVALLRYV
jgi:hypothetical protein